MVDVARVAEARVEVPGFDLGEIRWRHLLQQTSQWNGQLWGKPTAVDAQSHRDGD